MWQPTGQAHSDPLQATPIAIKRANVGVKCRMECLESAAASSLVRDSGGNVSIHRRTAITVKLRAGASSTTTPSSPKVLRRGTLRAGNRDIHAQLSPLGQQHWAAVHSYHATCEGHATTKKGIGIAARRFGCFEV